MRLDDSENEMKSLSGLNNIVIISLTRVMRDGLFVSVWLKSDSLLMNW